MNARTILLAVALLLISSSASFAQYVCLKCGRVHRVQVQAFQPAVYHNSQQSTTIPRPRASAGTFSVLRLLNAQRAQQGIRSLRPNGTLQAVAERRAKLMASMNMKTHPPGGFSPGRYEGVGWSSTMNPSGVYACYTSDRSMTEAGAAMVRTRNGCFFAVVYR